MTNEVRSFDSDREELEEEMHLLRNLFDRVFSPETALPGSAKTPASSGHCAAVSYLLWAATEAGLVSTRDLAVSHWFNRFKVKHETFDVDLTGDQFGYDPVRVAPSGSFHYLISPRNEYQIDEETHNRSLLLISRSEEATSDARLRWLLARARARITRAGEIRQFTPRTE